jgi:nucleoside-diphosphate-sugar epimerase
MWREKTLELINAPRPRDRVLIIGCAGFIGSWIAEALTDAAEVYCVDNLSTGRLENLSAVLDRVVFIKGDVAEVDLTRFDVAFHGAALSALDYNVQRPVETRYNSVSGAYLPTSVGEGV